MSLPTELLRAWINVHLKVLLKDAVKVMPLRQFAGTLIGYGVACGRGDGMTPDELRDCVEQALGETKPG